MINIFKDNGLFQEGEAQPGEIGDYRQSEQKDSDKRERGYIESQYRFFKTDA